MKKTISFLLLLALTASLFFGCGNAPRITGKDWVLASALFRDEVVYVSADLSSEAPSAEVLDCTLKAKSGTLTVTDNTNGKTYTGSYEKRQSNKNATADHRIAFGKEKGRILLSTTTLTSGERIATLTMTIDDYTLSFVAK